MSTGDTINVGYSVEDALTDMVDRAVSKALANFQPQAAKRLYSVKAAAEYLGRTEGAIRELERDKRLRSRRVARRVMFECEELDAFIERETE